MATGQSTNAPLAPKPLQFTLRHILFAMVACSIWFAASAQFGILGFVACYAATSLIAMGTGAFRHQPTLFLFGFAMLFFGCCIFSPDWGSREGSRRASCQNNIRNIALALQQYHDNQGCFPPPFIADASGKPMHSWRVLLLPYLDQQNLYKQYRFDEPWDGPNNSKLQSTVLKIYSCPSHSGKLPTTDTSYTVVVGPKTVFPESGFCRMADVIDGLSATILVVEVANSGIHWMEPRDLHVSQMPMAINPPRGQGISSEHVGGAQAAFVDGSVHFLPNDTSSRVLRAALTRNGKEPPGDLP